MLDITKPFILPVKICQIRGHGIWPFKTHQPAATQSARNLSVSFDADLISANVKGIVVSCFFFQFKRISKIRLILSLSDFEVILAFIFLDYGLNISISRSSLPDSSWCRVLLHAFYVASTFFFLAHYSYPSQFTWATCFILY